MTSNGRVTGSAPVVRSCAVAQLRLRTRARPRIRPPVMAQALLLDSRCIAKTQGARAHGEKHTKVTYRLQGRGAVVAALALGACLGIAAGGNIRVVGLLAVGHGGGGSKMCVSVRGCDGCGCGNQKRSEDGGGEVGGVVRTGRSGRGGWVSGGETQLVLGPFGAS